MLNVLIWTTMFALAMLVSISPLLTLPVGLVLAAFALTYGFSITTSALIGALAVTAGRGVLAYGARMSRRPLNTATKAKREQLSEWLGAQRRYRWLTFLAGFLPFVPASFVFPVLGSMRAPLRYAIAGSLLGQFALLLLTTTFAATFARAVTGTTRDAALFLAVTAIVWVLAGLFVRFDWGHFRTTHSLRMRPRHAYDRMRVENFLSRDRPGTLNDREATTSGEPVIEGEVLGEEHLDDDAPHS